MLLSILGLRRSLRHGVVAAVAWFLLAGLVERPAVAAEVPAEPPARLADTGLYADPTTKTLAPGVFPFSPQYPLWSDGAVKRRWIRLPAGRAIDASDPDAWVLPIGTRIWKEFAFARRIETRYMERTASGEWLYATYRWNEEETEATLAPARGVKRAAESRPGVPYGLPSVADCRACHESGAAPVLGFAALQLSSDRDPLAPHATPPEPGSVDLEELLRRGLVAGLPATIAAHAPRVRAETPTARAALGYLHGNCAGCHNGRGPLASLDFSLEVAVAPAHTQMQAALRTATGHTAKFQPAASMQLLRIAAGAPDASLLVRRMASRQAILQMPPLGTHRVDQEALTLVEAWIRDLGRPIEYVTAHQPVPSQQNP